MSIYQHEANAEGSALSASLPHFIPAEVVRMKELLRRVARETLLPNFGRVTAQLKAAGETFEIVTVSDIKSSETILREIAGQFPRSFTEEHQNSTRFEPRQMLWEIDPLDGTREYVEGLSDKYAMLAALLADFGAGYRPVGGVMYLPGSDEGAYGWSGEQPWLFKGEQDILTPTYDRTVLRGFMRQLDRSERLDDFYAELGQRLGRPVEIVEGGSSGQSFMALVQGKINLLVMPYNYSKEWDIAMAVPIVEALGGFVLDLQGHPFEFNRRDVFNRNGYVASIAFKPDEIFPLPADLLEDRLGVRGEMMVA